MGLIGIFSNLKLRFGLFAKDMYAKAVPCGQGLKGVPENILPSRCIVVHVRLRDEVVVRADSLPILIRQSPEDNDPVRNAFADVQGFAQRLHLGARQRRVVIQWAAKQDAMTNAYHQALTFVKGPNVHKIVLFSMFQQIV